MRVAFILPSLANKGPVVFTKYLIDALLDFSIEIEVFYFKEIRELDFSVPCHKISIKSIFLLSNFDIVHSTMLKPDVLVSVLRPFLKKRSVSAMHNFIKEDLSYLFPKPIAFFAFFCWKNAIKKVPNCIVSSYNMLDYYKSLLDSKPSFAMIPYGIPLRTLDVDRCDQKEKLFALKKKYTIIGSCGALINRKGFNQLVQLLKLDTTLSVVIIGDGEERANLLSAANDLGVSERLVLLGYKQNSIDYYAFFDIYAHVSYSEGFGLAMLEAMSQGLPILCSQLPIYKKMLPNESVSFYAIDDIQDMLHSLNKIKRDLKGYSDRSLRLYESTFTSKVMAKRHIELYKRIIGNYKVDN